MQSQMGIKFEEVYGPGVPNHNDAFCWEVAVAIPVLAVRLLKNEDRPALKPPGETRVTYVQREKAFDPIVILLLCRRWQKTPGFRLKATSPDKSQAFDAHHRKLAETSSGTLPKSQTMVLGGASAFSFRFPFSSFELVANRGNRNDEFRPLGFDLQFLS
jgi:hypothetical protein